MSELEPLATELRRELGTPPESWLAAQRVRLRGALREPPRRRMPRAFLLAAAAVLAVAGLGAWVVVPRLFLPVARDTWLVAEELREPYRFDDGSTLSLGPGGRGRLTLREDAVRFDLHAGRATFDVVPKQPRPWIISAGRNEVRVLGTRFSVLYGSGETFEVGVERGVVSVRVPDRTSSIQLEAGDRLSGRPGQIALLHGVTGHGPTPEPTPASPSADLATQDSSGVAPSAEQALRPLPSADWQASYREGNYVASLAKARALGVNKLIGELSPKGLAELADAARLGGDPELAVRVLSALLKRFPRSAESREGKFLLGRVHALRGDTNAAIDSFESYLRERGASLYASETIGRLMELYSARGERERARAMAERYLERAPNGPYRRLALSLLAPSP